MRSVNWGYCLPSCKRRRHHEGAIFEHAMRLGRIEANPAKRVRKLAARPRESASFCVLAEATSNP